MNFPFTDFSIVNIITAGQWEVQFSQPFLNLSFISQDMNTKLLCSSQLIKPNGCEHKRECL